MSTADNNEDVLEIETRRRMRIEDPSYFVERLGQPITNINQCKARIENLPSVAENNQAQKLRGLLSSADQLLERLKYILSATSREAEFVFLLWTALVRIYAERARTWIQYEQLVTRQLMLLSQMGQGDPAGSTIVPTTKTLAGYRFSAAICVQRSMNFEKVLAVLCRLTGGYDEYDVVAKAGERDGLAREWRAVVPQLPILPVELASPVNKTSVGLGILSALEAVTWSRGLVKAELSKSLKRQCNLYFIVSKLVLANVGMVVLYGFRNEHLMRSADLSYFCTLLSFLRSFGIGVVLQGTSALQQCMGPSFSEAFPQRLTQLGPLSVDRRGARKIARFYWDRLGILCDMPEALVDTVQLLSGQREWIEGAISRTVEHMFLHKLDANDAAKLALKETFADAMSGPMPAIIAQCRGKLSEKQKSDWCDWLLLPETDYL